MEETNLTSGEPVNRSRFSEVQRSDNSSTFVSRDRNPSSLAAQSSREPAKTGQRRTNRVNTRSRRGCHTCRRRKVKCDEAHPLCGDCCRLQLSCTYDSTAVNPAPAKVRKSLKPSLPAQQHSIFSADERLLPQEPGPFEDAAGADHIPGAQQSNFGDESFGNYSSNGIDNLAPFLDFDTSIRSTGPHPSLSVPENWEIELLGEDSLSMNIPLISNLIPVQSQPSAQIISSSCEPVQRFANHLSDDCSPSSSTSQLRSSKIATAVPAPHQDPKSAEGLPVAELKLLKSFVDFAVPPILVGVEPRWHPSRDALLRLSKTNSTLRFSICAFAALFMEETQLRSSVSLPSSQYYSSVATAELEELLDRQSFPNPKTVSCEVILGSIFFLSYLELISSKAVKNAVDLLYRAHTLIDQQMPSSSVLCKRLQVWLKLLDAKVVSAGGKGFHLYTDLDTSDLEIAPESDISAGVAEQAEAGANDNSVEGEDILFNSLNRQAYDFYLKVLNFSGRIARLDKWHRPRGSVEDELHVMLAAEKITHDLNALWTRRPAILDLAGSTGLENCLAPTLSVKVQHHLRTYTANFYACFIHLQRVAYAHLQAIPQIKPAVQKIVLLSRMTLNEGQQLPVSMLWPLMMAACECKEEETQSWIIECIERMEAKFGNAPKTAKLVREIIDRQKTGDRADARTVMHDIFGDIFAII